jgi:hypothetical protein
MLAFYIARVGNMVILGGERNTLGGTKRKSLYILLRKIAIMTLHVAHGPLRNPKRIFLSQPPTFFSTFQVFFFALEKIFLKVFSEFIFFEKNFEICIPNLN